MRAGALDQRITLQEHVTGVDPLGQPLDTWQDVGEFWAAVEPLQGREYINAGAMQSDVTTRIRMRYQSGIASAMRVLHGGERYNIQAVIHVKSARRELQLMCVKTA